MGKSPVETLRRLRKEFRAAHAKGTAPLKSGDYVALSEASMRNGDLLIARRYCSLSGSATGHSSMTRYADTRPARGQAIHADTLDTSIHRSTDHLSR